MQTVALQGRTIAMTFSGGLSSLSGASWLAVAARRTPFYQQPRYDRLRAFRLIPARRSQ